VAHFPGATFFRAIGIAFNIHMACRFARSQRSWAESSHESPVHAAFVVNGFSTPVELARGQKRNRHVGPGSATMMQRGTRNMPMYPEIMVVPMREELTRLGIAELHTAEEVDRALANQASTTLVVVNSICGCAAGRMRPAVRMALQNAVRPEKLFSVFAGQDREATDRARSYFTGQPPSSPSIAIFRDGQLAYMMPRRDIESREAAEIAADLKAAFEKFCSKPVPVQS
jgi:putative YphP/YqiW family bacilliredoxin